MSRPWNHVHGAFYGFYCLRRRDKACVLCAVREVCVWLGLPAGEGSRCATAMQHVSGLAILTPYRNSRPPPSTPRTKTKNVCVFASRLRAHTHAPPLRPPWKKMLKAAELHVSTCVCQEQLLLQQQGQSTLAYCQNAGASSYHKPGA
eukprot:364964-Chlamydomonas_euryale.AAC.21